MVLNSNWSSVVISDEISAVISVEISVAGWNIQLILRSDFVLNSAAMARP